MKKKQSTLNSGARALSRLAAVMRPQLRNGVPALASQPRILREGITILSRVQAAGRPGLVQPEQPFDRWLLALSPLYRKSRELYLKGGGRFRATLVSSPRTLGSPILLEQLIEYSPIERELIWAATDPGQRRDPAHLMRLRTYASSLFHEQSHRLLWRQLPPPSRGTVALRRYLNFVESLVIVLDMALGDELGPPLAAVFYLGGVIYDPGTSLRAGLSRRAYRNYLQAALHATYLNLELFEPGQIPDAVAMLFPMIPADLLARASARSLKLDRGFVTRTNPVWQQRHRATVLRSLSRLAGARWELPRDPLDNREQYLFAEKWFDLFGL